MVLARALGYQLAVLFQVRSAVLRYQNFTCGSVIATAHKCPPLLAKDLKSLGD